MGPETRNRVRGYGHGVTPDMVSYASSSSCTLDSYKRSSNSVMAVLMTENNQLKMREEKSEKRIADLEGRIEQYDMQQNQMFAMFMQRYQPQPPHSPGNQQSGPSQPQRSGPSQPPHTYPYVGHNQQGPYPMYSMPMQQPSIPYMQQPSMPYMQQHPMSYMQQPSYQMPVYRPEMAAHGGFCPEAPPGEFSRMLAGAGFEAGVGFDVDFVGVFGSNGGSLGQEGSQGLQGSEGTQGREESGPHSGSNMVG